MIFFVVNQQQIQCETMSRKLPDDKTLKALYLNQHLTMQQIGYRYGTTVQGVQKRLAALRVRGISRRVELDREELRALYVDRRLTKAEIAARLRVTKRKVKAELARYGIRRPRALAHAASLYSRSDIERLYVIQGLHQIEAAAKLGITTRLFQQLLVHYRIMDRHRCGLPRFDIDSEKLRRLYIHERRTATAIAEIFGCCLDTIRDRLQKLGIPIERGRQDPG